MSSINAEKLVDFERAHYKTLNNLKSKLLGNDPSHIT